MEKTSIDLEAARDAIRRAMEQLAARNHRACSLNVVDAAVRDLESECRDRAALPHMVDAVKAAILAMDEAGELECHVEPRRDWRLLT